MGRQNQMNSTPSSSSQASAASTPTIKASTSNTGTTSSSTPPSYSNKKPQKPRRRVATLAQRRAANIRERRRMFNLNSAFDRLRKKVPSFAYEKRLSRIETLKLAIMYIRFMDNLVNDDAYTEKYKQILASSSSSSTLATSVAANASPIGYLTTTNQQPIEVSPHFKHQCSVQDNSGTLNRCSATLYRSQALGHPQTSTPPASSVTSLSICCSSSAPAAHSCTTSNSRPMKTTNRTFNSSGNSKNTNSSPQSSSSPMSSPSLAPSNATTTSSTGYYAPHVGFATGEGSCQARIAVAATYCQQQQQSLSPLSRKKEMYNFDLSSAIELSGVQSSVERQHGGDTSRSSGINQSDASGESGSLEIGCYGPPMAHQVAIQPMVSHNQQLDLHNQAHHHLSQLQASDQFSHLSQQPPAAMLSSYANSPQYSQHSTSAIMNSNAANSYGSQHHHHAMVHSLEAR